MAARRVSSRKETSGESASAIPFQSFRSLISFFARSSLGWLVIEAFGRALPAQAAATKVWRDLFPSAEAVYTDGLRFMKQQWAAHAA